MENLTLLRDYLGGKKVIGAVKSELDLVPIIRAGFPYAAFKSMCAKSKLSEETINSSLGIAKRTAARRKHQAARLKPIESELLLRLARVLSSAGDVLGSEDKARAWLLRENRALGGKAPIRLLDTGIGFQQVMDVLKRIEYGVYS